MFGEMIGTISDFMYSYLLIIMLLAVGLYFTIRTRGVQLRLWRSPSGWWGRRAPPGSRCPHSRP